MNSVINKNQEMKSARSTYGERKLKNNRPTTPKITNLDRKPARTPVYAT